MVDADHAQEYFEVSDQKAIRALAGVVMTE